MARIAGAQISSPSRKNRMWSWQVVVAALLVRGTPAYERYRAAMPARFAPLVVRFAG